MMMLIRSVLLGVVSLCALAAQAQGWSMTSVNVEKYTQLANSQVRFTPGTLYDDSRGFEIFDFAVESYPANSAELAISSQTLAAVNGKYVMSLAAWEQETNNFGG